MEEYRIGRKPKISRRAAHELIQMLAKWGNHYTTRETFRTDADVKRAFARNGIDYDRLVEDCRNPEHSVPFFENLIGSKWNVSAGASVSRVNLATGKESTKTQGPGIFAPEAYWATYEVAHEALDRAAEKIQYSELLSAIVHGIASIEAFISARVLEWNEHHPDQEFVDSRTTKVTFDEKIDRWLSIITGRRLDKSGAAWQHFQRLRALRDNAAIHPKAAGYAIRYDEMVELINIFRTGIAGMLIELHVITGQRIPRVIIRDRYAPDALLDVKSGNARGLACKIAS